MNQNSINNTFDVLCNGSISLWVEYGEIYGSDKPLLCINLHRFFFNEYDTACIPTKEYPLIVPINIDIYYKLICMGRFQQTQCDAFNTTCPFSILYK